MGNIINSFSNTINDIYAGITNNFEELGSSIGDTDIGQVRYFSADAQNGIPPIQMWEILGFNDSNAGVPYNPRYWKNIIPKDYTILDRSGVIISGEEE